MVETGYGTETNVNCSLMRRHFDSLHASVKGRDKHLGLALGRPVGEGQRGRKVSGFVPLHSTNVVRHQNPDTKGNTQMYH
jgi:hypothetical protein